LGTGFPAKSRRTPSARRSGADKSKENWRATASARGAVGDQGTGRAMGHGRCYAGLGEKSKQFFFEKKNQKTFECRVVGLENWPRTPIGKSFLLLFFKKEVLFLTKFPANATGVGRN
jgi:hypothetical protein